MFIHVLDHWNLLWIWIRLSLEQVPCGRPCTTSAATAATIRTFLLGEGSVAGAWKARRSGAGRPEQISARPDMQLILDRQTNLRSCNWVQKFSIVTLKLWNTLKCSGDDFSSFARLLRSRSLLVCRDELICQPTIVCLSNCEQSNSTSYKRPTMNFLGQRTTHKILARFDSEQIYLLNSKVVCY